jgi:diguanylate cyclase (GGDEF)-like protein
LEIADVNRWSAPRADHGRVIRLGVALAAVAALITPFSGIFLGPSFPLFAMLLAASIMALSITALLLLVQARAMRSLPEAVLGAGFVYASVTLIPYALLYRGMFPGLGDAIRASPNAHEYLWFLWQIGLLAGILAFQGMRFAVVGNATTRLRGRVVIGALAILFAIATPCAMWLPGLPVTFEDGHWTPVFTMFMAPVIVLCALAAVIETLRRRNRASVLDAWIAIVSFGVIVEEYLTVIGVGRFTLGWYASRVVMLFATSVVLAVLLAQTARLYADLIQRAEELEDEAHTDTLTNLPNRRRFDEEFARAFGSAIRRSSPIAVALVDIDRFKQYNDSFGHQAGDAALHSIATTIAQSVERSGDFAARYGGEEFVVILEETTLGGACAVAERIRSAVLDTAIRAPGGGCLSVSVGVAARLPGSTGESLLRQADAALYEAKNAGRNRVAAWRSNESAPVGSAYDALADER